MKYKFNLKMIMGVRRNSFPTLFLSASQFIIFAFSIAILLIYCGVSIDKTKENKIKNVQIEGNFPNGDKYIFLGNFVDGLPTGETVRFFAVGHKFNLNEDVVDEKSYLNSYKKYMEIIKPHLSTRYVNFVVFEEHAGLPLLFFGKRGAGIRENANNTIQAAVQLISKIQSAMSYYSSKFPEVSTMQGRLVFLALTDTLWRVFFNAFSSLAKEYRVHILSCQNTPYPYIEKVNGYDSNFVDDMVEDKTFFFKATTSDVWNTCFIFSPAGDIVHATRKVNLVPSEKNDLQFSEGRYEDLSVFRIPGTSVDVCVGISLDAFVPEYVKVLDELGCDVFLQPDANSSSWASKGGLGYWQPLEWLSSTMGSIQKEYYVGCTAPHIKLFEGKCNLSKIEVSWTKNIIYNVNPMMTGNLFDLQFDGQTAITGIDKRARRDINYIGVPPLDELFFDGDLSFKVGGFVIMGPWTFSTDDFAPGVTDIDIVREIAREWGERLGLGGDMENMYISTIVSADLSLEPSMR